MMISLKELMKPAEKDVAAIKKKMDEINELVQKMSTELYQKAGQQYHQEHGKQDHEEKDEKSDDENVVDADYEVKDEKKGKKK